MNGFKIFVFECTSRPCGFHILQHLTDIYQNTHNILSECTQILQILTRLAGWSRNQTQEFPLLSSAMLKMHLYTYSASHD